MNTNTHVAKAGDAMPAAPAYIDPNAPKAPVPQREDYVPPVVPGYNVGSVLLDTKDALALHKFLEVNAVYPQEKAMADKLRGIIEDKRAEELNS